MGSITFIPARKQLGNNIKKAEKPKLRVAAYCRVSTDSDEQATSYDAQIEHYTEYISKNPEWTLAGIFADEGITGTNTKKREEFNRMIEECHAGNIDMVITKSISRFARNTLDCLKYIRELRDLNIPVYFEKESINTMDSKGDVLPSEMIQRNDRCKAARPLGIRVFGDGCRLAAFCFAWMQTIAERRGCIPS